MQDVPPWSGAFWVSDDGEAGYMTISNRDERSPRLPAGFELREVIANDDDDSETWVFDRSRGDERQPLSAVPISKPDSGPPDMQLAVRPDEAPQSA